MTRAIGVVALLLAVGIGGWLFTAQSGNGGPSSSAATQAEGQATLATASSNFSQVTDALQGAYAQTGTYAGALLPAGSGVTLVRATQTSYCIETNVNGTLVHEYGPGGSPATGGY